MSPKIAQALARLEGALSGEGEAAEKLAAALREARSSGEVLAGDGFEAAMEVARGRSEELARAGSVRIGAARELARLLGLPHGATVERLVETLGEEGGAVARSSQALRERLRGLDRESGALSVFSRYGVASCAHLLELRHNAVGNFSSYGPNGQMARAAAAAGRRA